MTALSLVLSSQVMAQSYQFEENLNYIDVKDDTGFASNWYMVSASGAYYFSPVETDDHPLQEASFLEKIAQSASPTYILNQVTHYKHEGDYYSAEGEASNKYSVFVAAVEGYFFE